MADNPRQAASWRLWFYPLFFDGLFGVFALISLPFFLKRVRQESEPGRLWRERFAVFTKEDKVQFTSAEKKILWVHAVSVGEVMAARPFVDRFLSHHLDWMILLTTVTPTGQQIARQYQSDRLWVRYFPFDFSGSVRRYLKTVRPSAILLVETEIWPNLILESSRQSVPVGIINGRLSEKSAKSYRLLRRMTAFVVGKLSFVLAQTEADAGRYRGLGLADKDVHVVGSMKFDNQSEKQSQKPEDLRRQWGFLENDLIWVAGSTHAGDEEVIAEALKILKAEFPQLKLLAAPRHVDRAEDVITFFQKQGFRAAAASDSARHSLPMDVSVLNRLGVLQPLYALADLVFVGGSLMKRGGQNPIEPARMKKGVLHGPYVHNFEYLYKKLDLNGGAVLVRNAQEMASRIRVLLQSEEKRKLLGEQAYAAVKELEGSTVKHYEKISRYLNLEAGVPSRIGTSAAKAAWK